MTDRERYLAAAHAMQSGVALDHTRGSQDGSPKHLRVGVNVAIRDLASITDLLVAKGLLSWEEFNKALADGMEQEVASYEAKFGVRFG